MKEKNRVVIPAWVLLALLGAAVIASAALTLWCSQYAPLFNDMIAAENMELYLTCVEVSTVAGTLGAMALLVGAIAYVVLLACHVMGKKPLSHKQKWVYTAITAGDVGPHLGDGSVRFRQRAVRILSVHPRGAGGCAGDMRGAGVRPEGPAKAQG